MPAPEWLMRFEINPKFFPLEPENADALANVLDDLSITIGVMAVEYRKGEHRFSPSIHVLNQGDTR